MLKTEVAPGKKIGTILFVDDELLSLKYFKSTVGKYANVKTASSPAAAMEILQADGDDISVVVSDERMPRESGVSFLSDVRKSWPSTVRVLTSAYADIDNLQHAINDAAIYRFVPKPWDLDELSAAMQDALHVERSADELTEPILGPALGGDAEDANLALLAILANGIEAPLKSLSTEARKLTQLSAQSLIDPPETQAGPSQLASWSSGLRQSKLAAAASQIQKEVEQCRSLMKSIGNLARGLASPANIRTSSMADTLRDVIEQNGDIASDAIDISGDFTYRMPREIMKFVLAHVLRGAHDASRLKRVPRIELFAGTAHNEVRIRLEADRAPISLDASQRWRTVRSALWAFGGELLASTDQDLGKSTLIVCLPKAA
ncbi:MAG: response regulator [Proteobacteria bacterium]|nr:response regulator [Pseudomonadota bacterium]